MTAGHLLRFCGPYGLGHPENKLFTLHKQIIHRTTVSQGYYRCVLITCTTISRIYDNPADIWATDPCSSTETAPLQSGSMSSHIRFWQPARLSYRDISTYVHLKNHCCWKHAPFQLQDVSRQVRVGRQDIAHARALNFQQCEELLHG